MLLPDSKRLVHPRADEDQPTVIDPAPLGVAAPQSNGLPVAIEDEKTVISQRPPNATSWSASTSANELGALLEGKQLGHFTLEKFVGGGGMGAVFRGRDNLLSRVVAVKVLSRDQGADLETLRRFKNEAQSAARLDHDNIARVFFVGEDDGWNFIVFEFIDGINVRDMVDRDGPLPLELAIDFTIQIAEALAHAAEREVVHRDIKPSNILVTSDRHAKLVDMGLARLHQMEAGQSDLTASGVTLGTFDYISPEQASDPRRADVRSDLYSLGCTLFFMLTGRPPFPQGTVLQKLLAHSGETPPDPRDDRPELPEAMSKVVHRLMAKRPDQRYRQPGELIGDLLVLRDRLGLARFGADGPWVVETKHRVWRDHALAWGVPLALLVLIFLALNVFWSNWSSQAEGLPTFRRPAKRVQSVVGPSAAVDETDIDAARPAVVEPPDDAPAIKPLESSNNTPSSGAATSDAPTSTSGDSSSSAVAPPAEPITPTATVKTPPTDSSSSPTVKPTVPTPTARTPLRLIMIGDASKLGDMGDSVAMFTSIGAALADADVRSQLAHIQAIEIRAPLVVERGPLKLELPEDAELAIRGVPLPDGQLPRIQFVAPPAKLSDFRGAFVECSGGKTIWENLHLELPVGDKSPPGELALIHLAADDGAHLEMRRCIVTIDNPPLVDAPLVACFDIQSLGDDHPAGVVPISLRDSIVRGRATLVRMHESLGLDLVWSNGLFVSNSPLLVADGATQAFDESGDGTIRLRLDDLTINTTSDLCQLRDSQAKPHQPALELECNRCIITADGSLVKHDGVGDAAKYAEALHISGSHNFYEGIQVFWRAYVDNVEQLTWDWPAWKKQLMRDGMPSYIGPVRWSRSRSDVLVVPAHLQGIDDYTLDPAASNPAVRDNAGFVAASLPQLVRLRESIAPPATDASPAPAP